MSKEQEVKDSADMPKQASVPSEPTPRAEFIKMDKASRKFVQKYGQPDLHHFLIMVGSDGILAQRVVNDLLAEKFGGEQSEASPALDVQAPQEENLTGKVDHTEDVAKKLHVDGESKVAPVNKTEVHDTAKK